MQASWHMCNRENNMLIENELSKIFEIFIFPTKYVNVSDIENEARTASALLFWAHAVKALRIIWFNRINPDLEPPVSRQPSHWRRSS